MKKATKFFSIMMAAAMTFSMTACGNSNTESANENSGVESGTSTSRGSASDTSAPAEGNADGKVYNIGILQQLEHPALDSATEGFQDALTEL